MSLPRPPSTTPPPPPSISFSLTSKKGIQILEIFWQKSSFASYVSFIQIFGFNSHNGSNMFLPTSIEIERHFWNFVSFWFLPKCSRSKLRCFSKVESTLGLTYLESVDRIVVEDQGYFKTPKVIVSNRFTLSKSTVLNKCVHNSIRVKI